VDTYRDIRRVLWITMGLNLLATAAKLAVGYITNSLSLIADGFDSVFDSASNVIGLVGIALAARPADKEHPYGHRKVETMTALIVAGLLFLTTWELAKSAIERLRDPSLIHAQANALSFGGLAASIVIHLWVAWYELRAGRRLGSDFLVADALHTRADVFVSISVAAGLVAVKLGFPLADPILALVVALLIAKIGVDIVREGSPTLMDGVAMPPDEVERIALSLPGVLSCHRVRSRGHDGAVYADLHIQVDPEMSTEQAHAVAHDVQYRLREKSPGLEDVTIHVEPAGSAPERKDLGAIDDRIRRLAGRLGIRVHDVWVHEVDEKYFTEAHLEADGELPLREAHAQASALEERARAEIPDLAELTTHIEPLAPSDRHDGSAWDEPRVERVVRLSVEEDLGSGACHNVQVRQSGATGWFISLHCALPGDTSLAESHRIGTRLEARLRGEIPGVVRVMFHAEPAEGPKEDP
jgi:cation diffusion facilitator family transporter